MMSRFSWREPEARMQDAVNVGMMETGAMFNRSMTQRPFSACLLSIHSCSDVVIKLLSSFCMSVQYHKLILLVNISELYSTRCSQICVQAAQYIVLPFPST
ncbi:hypothetical protein COCON_G00030550 [Conger conger]|uniref:Uncharacterized protein n=1 Tax=Conger conger TaxID=82655 RepID=A0A9Q1I735_CONCO|nr:hypothetical protein COCON_G00030550 [Conger conger]